MDSASTQVEGGIVRMHREKQSETGEPVGIVISDGGNGNVTSRLAAFVWGPVPEEILSDIFDSVTAEDGALLAAIA